jgi:hypothetical protein
MKTVAEVLADMRDVADDTYEGVAGAKRVAQWLAVLDAPRPEAAPSNERRPGKYRLVYNKATKRIDKVSNVDGLVAESFDPPEDCASNMNGNT